MTSFLTTASPATYRRILPVSAALFVAAWVFGLLAAGSSLGPSPTGAEVQSAYSGNTSAAVQGFLVHGLAGVALAGVGISIAGLLRNAEALVPLTWLAVLLSLGQLVGELVLVLAPALDAEAAHGWWIALTLMDGAKMIALSALMLAVAVRVPKRGPKRTFFVPFSVAAAVAMAVSGIGYASMGPTLMNAAYVSLPLLLAWTALAPFALSSGRQP